MECTSAIRRRGQAISNLQKDVNRGFDQTVFVAVKQETLDTLEKKIREKVGDQIIEDGRVAFMLIKEFVK